MFTVLAAHWLTANERLTFGKVAGVLTGFAGVAVLIGPDAFAGRGGGDIVGEAACLFAAISYAFAGIYGRRFRGLNPIKAATGQVTGSTFVLLPCVALADRPWTLPMPSAEVWGAMLGIAVLSKVIAYILYFRILAAAGATNLLLVTFLLPVSALLLGWLAPGGEHRAKGLCRHGDDRSRPGLHRWTPATAVFASRATAHNVNTRSMV